MGRKHWLLSGYHRRHRGAKVEPSGEGEGADVERSFPSRRAFVVVFRVELWGNPPVVEILPGCVCVFQYPAAAGGGEVFRRFVA